MWLIIEGADEYHLTEGDLLEAKGRIPKGDERRDALVDLGFELGSSDWKRSRTRITKTTNVQFKRLTEKLSKALSAKTSDFLAQRISYTRWAKESRSALRDAYMSAFRMGLRSSGAGDTKMARGILSERDRRYVESSYRQEVKFFNKLLEDIRRGTVRGVVERRLTAYVDALKHVYYAGRVAGTPSRMIVDWVPVLTRVTCGGCRFLAFHSPYSKDKLPSLPRSGDTPCRDRCKCRLVMREVSREAYQSVRKSLRSQGWYRRQLKLIKDGKPVKVPTLEELKRKKKVRVSD